MLYNVRVPGKDHSYLVALNFRTGGQIAGSHIKKLRTADRTAETLYPQQHTTHSVLRAAPDSELRNKVAIVRVRVYKSKTFLLSLLALARRLHFPCRFCAKWSSADLACGGHMGR
jgi:hypothetical protein